MTNFVPDASPIRSMPFWIEAITSAPSSAAITPPPEEARAADHRGGDDEEEQVAAAGVGGDRPETGREHDPADAGHEAADHEDRDPDAIDVDSSPSRRLRIPTDGVDVPPEARPAGDERPEEKEDSEDEDHLRHAAVLVQVPDGCEGHDREADRLQHDQHRRLPHQALRPACERCPQLKRGVCHDHDHGQDPSPELAQEVLAIPTTVSS